MDLSKYYRRLITLPSARTLALLSTTLIVVYLSIRYLVSGRSEELVRETLIITTAILSPFALPKVYGDRRVYTKARLLFMGLLPLPAVMLMNISLGKRGGLLPLMPAIYLQLIGSQLVHGISLSRAMIVGLINITPVATFDFLRGVYSLRWLTSLLASMIVPEIALLSMIIIIKREGRAVGLDLLSMGIAFAKMWLTGRREVLEKELVKLSQHSDIRVHVVVLDPLERKDKRCVIIAPELHFGPFRDVGSSEMPALIIRKIKRQLGYECVVLHGAVTHKRDLATSEDAIKVADEIARSIEELRTRDRYGVVKPVIVEGRKFKICGISLGKVPILMISPLWGGIEDIPHKYWKYAREKAKEAGFEDALLIDEHNSIADGETISYDELYELIRRCIKELATRDKEEILVGVASSNTPLDRYKGLGEGGIRVLYLEGIKSKHAFVLVVIDGNNMKREFRIKMESMIKKLGIKHVEILTTDTHSVSGIIRGGRGYVAVGERKEHEVLLNIVCKCVLLARASKKKAIIGWEELRVPRVRIYGEALPKIYDAIRVGYRAFMNRAVPISVAILVAAWALFFFIIT